MREKIFRVMSNSEELLSADTIAMALLNQVTLHPKGKGAIFGVMEVENSATAWNSYPEACVGSKSQSL